MEQARILRVVAASPGDVQAERDLLPGVIEELNRGIAAQCGFRLDLYRWETHAYPGMHAEGPQGLIDPILRVEDCDVLIGIFWTRFGTPTKAGKTGTEHEFNLAYKAWKRNRRPQVMVYFSQKPHTPKSSKEIEQWGSVLEFRERFPEEGLWWLYEDEKAFEKVARNHLTSFIQQLAPTPRTESVDLASSVLNALHSLPPPPADFIGRTDELAELRAAIEQGGVTISGLQGQGGVGKTALALKLAEELSPKFPDAQLYLDLRGASANPLSAVEAMAFVIRAFHPEAKLPEGEAGLSAIYQSVLHGKRALLLMDNARDANQVKPLLPPKPCALLITSRKHFALPGLHPTDLNTLPPADAERLLLEVEKRIDGEAAKIAKLCGYLPLALRLAGSALAERSDLAPADYSRRLEKERLKLLEGSEASISLSYALLDVEMQKRSRMLGIFPDTFNAAAATAVWEMEGDAAQDALSVLVQYSMLEWSAGLKRYRLHDLMHDFARQRLEASDRDQAASRHAAHYLDVLWETHRLYTKGGNSVTQALALFDLEWGNIRGGQSWAAEHAGQDPDAARLCSGYPGAGAYCLSLRLHPRQQIVWLEAALVAARGLKDREAEGRHLGNLGLAYADLGETRRAIEYYEQQLTITREIGDRRGEGAGLGNLGLAYKNLGETRHAIEYYEQALPVLREIGDRRAEGAVLGNLGNAYLNLGETRRAIEYHEQALAIDREIGDRRGEGQDFGNLGSAYYRLGEYRRAIEYYDQHLTITREIGDRLGEANALSGLGLGYGALGETRRELGYHEQHLAITREIGDRRGEGNALWNMSVALDKLGEGERAIEHAEAALVICEQIEDPKADKVRKQLEEWKAIG